MADSVIEAGEAPKDSTPKPAENGSLSKIDLIMRIVAVIGTLASAIAMATTNESLPFAAQVISFKAQYNDLPAFSFFVVSNALVCAYLVLSLALSTFHIFKSGVQITRLILIMFDTAMLALLSAGASAAAVIVHLAHKGNSRANWFAICQQYNYFCERITGSLVGSFMSVLVLMVLIMLSAVAISRS